MREENKLKKNVAVKVAVKYGFFDEDSIEKIVNILKWFDSFAKWQRKASFLLFIVIILSMIYGYSSIGWKGIVLPILAWCFLTILLTAGIITFLSRKFRLPYMLVKELSDIQTEWNFRSKV